VTTWFDYYCCRRIRSFLFLFFSITKACFSTSLIAVVRCWKDECVSVGSINLATTVVHDTVVRSDRARTYVHNFFPSCITVRKRTGHGRFHVCPAPIGFATSPNNRRPRTTIGLTIIVFFFFPGGRVVFARCARRPRTPCARARVCYVKYEIFSYARLTMSVDLKSLPLRPEEPIRIVTKKSITVITMTAITITWHDKGKIQNTFYKFSVTTWSRALRKRKTTKQKNLRTFVSTHLHAANSTGTRFVRDNKLRRGNVRRELYKRISMSTRTRIV